MIKLPWKKSNTPQTDSDKLIQEIRSILFPPLKLESKIDSDGEKVIFHIDYSVDSNLDSVLMDLQEGYNDVTSQKTISKVISRISRVRKLLNASINIHDEAKYIIVDDMEESDEIRATED